nr:alkaline phosphatase family protein [Mycobacterium kansasii]
MPQNLSDAGVSWKVYSDKSLGPRRQRLRRLRRDRAVVSNRPQTRGRIWLDSASPPAIPGTSPPMSEPNRLPQVSWLVPNILVSEHPAMPDAGGAVAMADTLRILLSNPAVWEKTAADRQLRRKRRLLRPRRAADGAAGHRGEYLTVPDIDGVAGSGGIRGPIGLGFRVPCLVISPFSRGGLMAHDVFRSHLPTPIDRETVRRCRCPKPHRHGARSVTGDMTSAFKLSPSHPTVATQVATNPDGCCRNWLSAASASAR